MAEEEGAGGAGEQAINGGDGLPQIGIIAQYVKDMSFENPNAPAVFQWQGQTNMDAQFNIGAGQVGDDIHEVALKIEVTAKSGDNVAFRVDLLYAGLFAIRNVPDEQLRPFLLAEAPRLLFPFARRIIADATVDGGFPPFMMEPIDFHALYLQRAAQEEAGAIGGTVGDVTGRA